RDEAVEHGPHRSPGHMRRHAQGNEIGRRAQEPRDDHAARRRRRRIVHAEMGRAVTSWVANTGGHTTARCLGATHSHITLCAARFWPASVVPGGAMSMPLPLGSEPDGALVCRAAVATAAGSSDLAFG